MLAFYVDVQIYIEPWHADIFEVLDLRKNTGMVYATFDLNDYDKFAELHK